METTVTTAVSFDIDTVEIGPLAEAIATDGIAAHEQCLAGLLAGARSAAVSPVLISVLADPREPAAARERAFGRIAMELATPHARSFAVRHIAARPHVTDVIRQRSTARVLTAA